MIAFWLSFWVIAYGLIFFLAKKEIHTEGKRGWAKGLPTWRIQAGWFENSEGERRPLTGYKNRLSRWIVLIMGGRDLTGYHLYLTFFILFMIHIPLPFFLLFGLWTWRWECMMLSLLPILLLFEDFLWFVLNPHYGLSKFRKSQIPWHPHWWGPVPDCYWWYAAIAAVLISFGWPS